MQAGDDVVYVRCRCEVPCAKPELCGIGLFGTMEFRNVQKVAGRLLCRLDSGEFETFDAHEIELVDVIAARAVREAVDAAPAETEG